MSSYDVVIIGSGPGGYVSAIRCAQLGMKTAIIEKYSTLGGTCLNVGCIPSKALLDSSEHYYNAMKNFKEHGIKIENTEVDFPQMMARKDRVIAQTCEGINYLMDKNNIEVYNGAGSFVDTTHIKITKRDGGQQVVEAKKTVIATGSKPIELPFLRSDKKRVITSTEALKLSEIPKKMIVIGGGIIGLELGSVYARMGTEVTVIEYSNSIIPTMDKTMGKELQKSLKKIGFRFHLSCEVTGGIIKANEVIITAKDKKDKQVEFAADYCLVAVGRKPYTDGLGLENVGIKLDERSGIETNAHLQTSVENIYAIGDVVKGPMLAHKAEEEGVMVAEYIAGQKPHIDYNLIPGVVYTWPEVAAVGQTEEQLKEKRVDYKVGSFPMRALGRARASMDTEGVVKVLADAQTDEILGVHMIGARAADMIAEAVVSMEFRASAEDIARVSHAHPTFTEAIKEAALDAAGKRAIHS